MEKLGGEGMGCLWRGYVYRHDCHCFMGEVGFFFDGFWRNGTRRDYSVLCKSIEWPLLKTATCLLALRFNSLHGLVS